MPNYIVNVVAAPAAVLADLLDESQRVDFNRVVPQPANIEKGGCSGIHDDGVICWYDWNLDHWGTKWNASTSEVDDEGVTFKTAWASPEPVLRALSAKHPDQDILVTYADEDLGYNVGRYTLHGGQVTTHDELDDTDEGRDLAAKLHYNQTYAELKAEWDAEDNA